MAILYIPRFDSAAETKAGRVKSYTLHSLPRSVANDNIRQAYKFFVKKNVSKKATEAEVDGEAEYGRYGDSQGGSYSGGKGYYGDDNSSGSYSGGGSDSGGDDKGNQQLNSGGDKNGGGPPGDDNGKDNSDKTAGGGADEGAEEDEGDQPEKEADDQEET